MPRRRVEQVPPDRAARLDVADLAAYMRLGDTEIDRCITWHDDHHGAFTYGPVTVDVYRNVLNGAAYIFRRHLDHAIEAAYTPGGHASFEHDTLEQAAGR